MDDLKGAGSLLKSHPDRAVIAAEIHNRPAPEPPTPVRVSHIAMMSSRDEAKTEREFLVELCQKYSALPPAADALYHVASIGELEMRWERHTEFSAFTFFRSGPIKTPFGDTALALVPEAWLRSLPGRMVAGCHISVYGADGAPTEAEALSAAFEGHHLVGGTVMNGNATLWTSLRLHGDDFGRYLIRNYGLRPARVGRLLQRVLDLETYRMMALLGLPVARRTNAKLDEGERRLVALTQATAVATKGREERELLDQLTALAAAHEDTVADTAYRFAATRAYGNLVGDRLARLHLEKFGDLQPLSDFLQRRFEPAMRTCQAMESRMDGLSQRINRAANLLRTRVDLALEDQNQQLLTSMDQRARLQLRLQQTVEGLSVAAISYYVVGLLSYAIKGVAPVLGAAVANTILALAVPLVVWSVWTGVRRVRKGLDDEN